MSATCPHCGRPFGDTNGCFSHIKGKPREGMRLVFFLGWPGSLAEMMGSV